MRLADYLDVGGVRAFIEDARPDPATVQDRRDPVLLLHTAGQSGVQWRDTVPSLTARGHRVIVPDLPGHGRSEPVPGGPVEDLGWYADWSRTLMEALGIHHALVVGCSIGGKVALHLATTGDALWVGAVSIAAQAHRPRLSERGLRRELEDSAAPSRSDRTYLGTLAACGSAVPRNRRELIAVMHRREDPQVSVSDLIGWARHDVSDRLSEARCPVHVVAGTEDFWLDLDAVRATAAGLPDARLTVLERIGHYPMEEISEFGPRLCAWLADLMSPRADARESLARPPRATTPSTGSTSTNGRRTWTGPDDPASGSTGSAP